MASNETPLAKDLNRVFNYGSDMTRVPQALARFSIDKKQRRRIVSAKCKLANTLAKISAKR